MRPAENINKMINKLELKASARLDEKVHDAISAALEESEQTTSAIVKPSVWSTIMKNRISKLATAAVIIVAAALAITFMGRFTAHAYALEQTIQANHSIRYIHIRQLRPPHNEPILIWAQFDDIGDPMNLRLELPAWSQGTDGAKVVTWKDNKATVWLKDKNFVVVVKEEDVAARMLEMAEENDPAAIVRHLRKLENDGQVRIEIKQPSDKSKPIVLTAKYMPESATPNQKLVVFVDQASKLALSSELYELENGTYQKCKVLEFYDYNKEINPKMFVLENEEPTDVTRINQMTQDIGLAQGELSNEAVAAKVVRCFFEALISKDYAEAGRLYQGIPLDKMQKSFGGIKFVRIISIGPAAPHPIAATGGLIVPCTVEIEKDGKVIQWKLDQVGVRPVYNQPNRWTIFGGI